MLDKRSIVIGVSLFVFDIVLGLILFMKPFEATVMDSIISAVTLVAFVICFIYSYLALKLYGRKSSEGRFWFFVVIMLVLLLIGFLAALVSFKAFSFFAAIAFVLIIYGILDKMKSSGARPGKSDLVVAGIVTIFILTLLAITMRSFRGQTPEDFNMMDYALEWFVIILAFLLTFLTVVMGCIMGAHISEGWYLLAAGASIFAISYTLQTVLNALGLFHEGHFIGVLDAAALLTIAFSAYYQRKKHLELISDLV